MKLCHKYGMPGVAQLQTEALMVPLRTCATEAVVSEQQIAFVLDCAAAAEECGLTAMLGLCEAIIITNFTQFALDHKAMTLKLSSASMFRIAQGHVKLQSDVISDLERALGSCVEEAKTLSQQLNKVVKHLSARSPELCQVSCPRCSSKLHSMSMWEPMQHDSSCKCKKACTWPQHTFKQKNPVVANVIYYIAGVHNIPVQAIGIL